MPPCGGHRRLTGSLAFLQAFQVVPPCGGHQGFFHPAWCPCSFKSCPRVGGILCAGGQHKISAVSSRAPVWGASYVMDTFLYAPCFKSCPRVGGIIALRGQQTCVFGFKSCPRVGGILVSISVCIPDVMVSSRAPVWGASRQNRGHQHRRASFKSCPRVGGIRRRGRRLPHTAQFQVVPPCGGLPDCGTGRRRDLQFQVVPPCGGHQAAASAGPR